MKSEKQGWTIWFTGLACSGKTTIANKLRDILDKRGVKIIILDSDDLRSTVSKDYGYTKDERDRHMRLVTEMGYLLSLQGMINVAAVISPTRKVREDARNRIKNFIEVYIKCPLEICKKRDVKSHYKEFEEGKIKDFVGLNIPYEEPLNPEVIAETDKEDINTCVNKIIIEMKSKGIID